MMKTILSNLTERLSLLESGKLTQAEMELLVEDSKELYERLVILRYKLYETNVFVPQAIVEPSILEQSEPVVTEVEKPTFDLFDMDEEESISDEGEEDEDEEEILASEVGLFNFGIDTPEVSPEISEEPELVNEPEQEAEVDVHTEALENEAQLDDDMDSTEEISAEEIFEEEEELSMEIEVTHEEAHTEEVVEPQVNFKEEVSMEMEETQQEAHPEEVAEPQVNFLDNISNPESTSINSAWILQIEQTIRSDRSVFPLETLIGSFSLNEKLQFINELFDGSSDAFSSATKKLDACENMSVAREQLSDYASSYNWDLESEIVEDFIFKICRRYAAAHS
jgi:hypothetical protein